MTRKVKSVSVLIPTHNRAPILEQTLATVTRLRIPSGVEAELIVVANACQDNTVAICQQFVTGSTIPLRVVEEAEPGLSAARNRAVNESRGDTIAFLDDDVLVPETWLESLVRDFDLSNADLLGGRIELWWKEVSRPEWLDEQFDSFLSRLDLGPRLIEVNSPAAAIGANFAFRRIVFDSIGKFRKDLGRKGNQMLSGEETDFIRRGLLSNFTMFYSADAWIKHWVAKNRIDPGYLAKVAFGNGVSAQLARSDFGPATVFRSFVSHLPQAAWHFVMAQVARVTGNRKTYTTRMLKMNKAWGRFSGTLMRMVKRDSINYTSTGPVQGNGVMSKSENDFA